MGKANPQALGGGALAKTTGTNRKASIAYDARSVDYNKMVGQAKVGNGSRTATGYTKPGSRKKVH